MQNLSLPLQSTFITTISLQKRPASPSKRLHFLDGLHSIFQSSNNNHNNNHNHHNQHNTSSNNSSNGSGPNSATVSPVDETSPTAFPEPDPPPRFTTFLGQPQRPYAASLSDPGANNGKC